MKKRIAMILTAVLCTCSLFSASAAAAPDEEGQTQAVSTAPPVVEAESAILMDAGTGTVLYEKNIHTRQYPASITKIMTALLAQENCDMDEVITFSHNAVYTVERGSSNIGIDEKETLTMEDALYALLLASANEVANGIAEHVAGSAEDFAQLMNQRAKELGCEDTHFVNPHGLPDEEHYTTAYDMALIARAFFLYENLSTISGTTSYHIDATATQPDEIDLGNHNKMLPGTNRGTKYYYEGLVGGKTGYTDVARQTLVTCAEKDGVRLICVVMKDESPGQYQDSAALYDYGFANYRAVSVWEAADGKTLIEEACQLAENATGNAYQVIEDPTETEDSLLLRTTTPLSELTYTASFDAQNSQVTFWFADGTTNAGSVVIPVYEVIQFQGDQLLEEGQEDEEAVSDQVKTEAGIAGRVGHALQQGMKVLFCIVLVGAFAVLGFFVYQRRKAEKERIRRQRALMERRRRRQEQELMEERGHREEK